jgi:4'-phosphopantetheinyl transferase
MNRTSDLYWLTERAGNEPRGSDWLGGRELEKLEQLRFTKRRADWRLGRWTAKRAVCAYLSQSGPVEPSGVEIIAAADGAPQLYIGGAASPWTISISHSHGTGFCVVSPDGLAVGCDVESIEPRSGVFAADYFTSSENHLIERARGDDRVLLTTLVWSAKESALKALRTGLDRDTRSVEVREVGGVADGSDGWNRMIVDCDGGENQFFGWWREEGKLLFTIASGALTCAPKLLS